MFYMYIAGFSFLRKNISRKINSKATARREIVWLATLNTNISFGKLENFLNYLLINYFSANVYSSGEVLVQRKYKML